MRIIELIRGVQFVVELLRCSKRWYHRTVLVLWTILFWFVFTIGDIAGFMECSLCGVKEAAFFQAISLASVTPLLLWQSRRSIRNHANKLLLTAFIPSTLVGTPVGQLLQKTARAEVVRLIVGIFILIISAFESF